MNKEEALEEFLKGLKVVFSNASAYSHNHPYFVKSVETFKFRIDDLQALVKPLKVGFTPEQIFFDGAFLKKSSLHDELAALFHARKIKSVELNAGISVEELSYFFSKVSLAPREIIKAGGLQMLLETQKVPHISTQELDYSILLHDETGEEKDTWLCLFQGIMTRGDHKKIMEIADHFEGLLSHFKVKDIMVEPQLKKDIRGFLRYLDTNNSDKFRVCSKALFKLLLKDRQSLKREDMTQVMEYFKGLDAEFFAGALWEEITTNENFDSESFNLFTHIVDSATNLQIFPFITQKLKSSPLAFQNQRIAKRFKELFNLSKETHIASSYLEALTFLSQESAFSDRIIFESESLYVNYHLILLNLLAEENDEKRLESIIERILVIFEKIVKERKLEYFDYLFEVVKQRKTQNAALVVLFEPLDKRIAAYIETMAFDEEIPMDFEFFIDALQTSSMGIQAYFDKIFVERRINPCGLKLLLRLFPQELDHFYEKLQKQYFDLDFLERIVESLQWVHLPIACDVLKEMYSFANNLIKIEIVRAMGRISSGDDEFLFGVLKSDDFALKKEALLVLMRRDSTKQEALRKLFAVKNPWGRKNNVFLAHLALVEEVEARDALEYVVAISRLWLFWHSKIRKKAAELLQRWNSGENRASV